MDYQSRAEVVVATWIAGCSVADATLYQGESLTAAERGSKGEYGKNNNMVSSDATKTVGAHGEAPRQMVVRVNQLMTTC